jgi:hypothetical protein
MPRIVIVILAYHRHKPTNLLADRNYKMATCRRVLTVRVRLHKNMCHFYIIIYIYLIAIGF